MTTPARLSEADRVEEAFHWAVSALGNGMAAEAKRIWEEYVPASSAGIARAHRAYMLAVLAALAGYRIKAQQLAVAYYRLNRALRTGTTVSIGDETKGETVSLEKLRDDFDDLLDEIEQMVLGDPIFSTGSTADDFVPDDVPDVQYVSDDADIEVDLVIDLDVLIEEADEEAEQEMRTLADTLGTGNFKKKIERATRRDRADDNNILEAKDAAGNRQAAAAMRIMMNAARGLVYDLGEIDMKIQGWVRRSLSGTPCGFCAMLIAREDLYATRANAQHQGKGASENKYHDNCKCVTIPIFDLDQFLSSDLADQHKHYADLWKRHIKGKYGGDKALSVWRKLIRDLEGEAGSTESEQSPGEAA